MLDPIETNLFGFVGVDYYDTWEFWDDPRQTVPYDFTNWTQFTLAIGALVFNEANGLTVDRTNGTVSPSIDRTVTALRRPGTASYALSAIDENGKLGFLMLGVFEWKRGNPT